MTLMSALSAAMSGLRSTQAGIDLVAQNVANADSVGYTRRRLAPVEAVTGGRANGVRTGAIERVLDLVAQKQLRLETSGAAYTGLRAAFAGALDQLFGQPGGAGSLDGAVNAFTMALQGLASDPANASNRSDVIDKAQGLAGRIASIASGVQALRTEAEARLGSAVGRANELIGAVADLNGAIVAAGEGSPALLDQRDRLVNELSGLMDVQAQPGASGAVRLTTTAGQTLVDGVNATRLTFDARGALGPESLYSPTDARVGVVRAISPGGVSVDLVAGRLIRSGEIAAALEMRDETLAQAQRQLDELAAGLSRALSDRPAPVTAVAGGFDIDLAGLQAGNAVTLDVAVGGAVRRVVIVPTLGGAPSPIPPAATGDPHATVLRLDLAGGVDGADATALQTALGAAGIGVAVASPASGRLTFTNGAAAVTGVSAGITVTGLAEGAPQLPLFVDAGRGNAAFTGSFEGGSQLAGFAQRIAVNPALNADRSRLVVSGSGVAQGDAARPQHLFDSLTQAARAFSGAAGIDGGGPTTATVAGFARRIVETQGAAAEAARRLDEGQSVALASIESRFAESAGVNIDQEMAQLVALQTAYGANARLMTAVRDMMDLLLRI